MIDKRRIPIGILKANINAREAEDLVRMMKATAPIAIISSPETTFEYIKPQIRKQKFLVIKTKVGTV
jgi:hypothetical protein